MRFERLHLARDIHPSGFGRTGHGVGGQVDSHGAIALQQPLLGHTLHIGQLSVTHPVPLQEEEPPIALGHGFAHGNAHGLRVAETLFPAFEPSGLGAFEFFCSDGLGRHGLQGAQQFIPRSVGALPGTELCTEDGKTRLSQCPSESKGAGGKLFFSQPLVQTACWGVAQNQTEQLHCREVGMGRRWDVITRVDQGHATFAAQGNAALAVLGGIQCVGRWQRHGTDSQWLLQGSKGLIHPGQNLLLVELARDDEGGVVGLVIPAIKGLQARNIDVLHITACTYGAFAVVVPLVHGGQGFFKQDTSGAVLALLHLVAHHSHFRIKVFAGDEAVDHGIGLPGQVPAQVVVVGRKTRGVVGAVIPGAAVGGEAPLVEVGPDLGVLGGTLEQQMLQQMRHAGLAVTLLPRTHAVGHVDRCGGFGFVRYQEQLQTVGEAVFLYAFDSTYRFDGVVLCWALDLNSGLGFVLGLVLGFGMGRKRQAQT